MSTIKLINYANNWVIRIKKNHTVLITQNYLLIIILFMIMQEWLTFNA